jgi:hypothetical protein
VGSLWPVSVAAVSVSALVSATERVAAAPTHLETAIYVLEKTAICADAQRRGHWLNAHRSDRCGIGAAPNVNRNPTILPTQNVEEPYILAAVISIIIAFFQIVSAFEIRWSAGLLAMVMATVGYLIFMLFVRVTLESLVALVRTAENTTLLLEQKH